MLLTWADLRSLQADAENQARIVGALRDQLKDAEWEYARMLADLNHGLQMACHIIHELGREGA